MYLLLRQLFIIPDVTDDFGIKVGHNKMIISTFLWLSFPSNGLAIVLCPVT